MWLTTVSSERARVQAAAERSAVASASSNASRRLRVVEQVEQGGDAVAADHRSQQRHRRMPVETGTSHRAGGDLAEEPGLHAGRLGHAGGDLAGEQVQKAFVAGAAPQGVGNRLRLIGR
jgi:hypothetical protein